MSDSRAFMESLPLYSDPDEQPQWYAACTCARHEKQVAKQLAYKQMDHLLPLYETTHQWKNGRKKLQLPLFPGYVFVRLPATERVRVLRIPSVAYLVSSSTGPLAIPEEEIAAVRRLLDGNVCVEPHPYLSVGDRVRVTSGALAGMEGVLVRKKDSLRVVISIQAIMRSVIADVDSADIEPVCGKAAAA